MEVICVGSFEGCHWISLSLLIEPKVSRLASNNLVLKIAVTYRFHLCSSTLVISFVVL
jgi:hypothetical protein